MSCEDGQITIVNATAEKPFIGSAAPVQEQGKPTAILRFCDWTSPTYGSQGEMGWTIAFKAAELAIAIANSAAQQQIADAQMDLADRWFSHQKYKWTRFQNAYLPLEKKLVQETAYVPMPTLDCDNAEARAHNQTKRTGQVLDNWMARKFKGLRICGHASSVRRCEVNACAVHVDCYNFNLADERWYKDFQEDKRWNNRSNVLNLGRNMDSQAQSYGDLAGKIFGAVGQQLDRFGSAAMTALGYFGTRNEGFIPMTFLSTGGQSEPTLANIQNPNSLGNSWSSLAYHHHSPGGLGG